MEKNMEDEMHMTGAIWRFLGVVVAALRGFGFKAVGTLLRGSKGLFRGDIGAYSPGFEDSRIGVLGLRMVWVSDIGFKI